MSTATRPRSPYRSKIAAEPPPPLAAAGQCKFPGLLQRVIPERVQHQTVHPCYESAARRVQVGLTVRADVCLWHSLVACQRLNAHLIRDLTFL